MVLLQQLLCSSAVHHAKQQLWQPQQHQSALLADWQGCLQEATCSCWDL